MKKQFYTFVLIMVSLQCFGNDVFKSGPVIQEFGKHAKVQIDQEVSSDTEFKVVFDVSKISGEKTLNRYIESLARFMNMLVANGVDQENIHLALVVHGKAGSDLLNQKAYQARFATDNPNHAMLNALLQNNVQIFLCGQSAAYDKIANQDLIGGVQMALSAMTAHALLSQQGYSLNPF